MTKEKMIEEIKGEQFIIKDKDLNREITIAATLKSISKIDVIREAFKDYKIKQRLKDRVEEFKRGG
jgi:hypothetical protein